MAQRSGKTKSKMRGRRSEGHVTDHRNKRRRAEDRENGSVFRGRPVTRRRCTAVDGLIDRWISGLEPVASVDLVSVSN